MTVVATVIGGGAVVAGTAAASAGEPATVTVGTTAIQYGTTADITVDVAAATSGDPVPQGSVDLLVDGNDQGSQTLDGTTDHLDFNVGGLSLGSHTVEADYTSSDGIFDNNSGTGSQEVDMADPTLSVASSGTPSLFGQSVTFTATLTDGAGAVSGSMVTFTDGATVLGTPTTDATGTASVSVASLAGGAHTISVSSTATTNDNAAGPSTTPQQVNPNSMSLSAPDITMFAGDSSDLPIQATALNSGTIAPKVAFKVILDNATTIIPDGGLDSTGFSDVGIGPFTAGNHTLTIITTATTNWNSASKTVNLTVSKETTSTIARMTFASSPHTNSTPVTLKAFVTPNAGQPVLSGGFNGSFEFFLDGVDLGSVPATSKGKATMTLAGGIGGTKHNHTFTAVYLGDNFYQLSANAAFAHTGKS
jgi:hypothetical protein